MALQPDAGRTPDTPPVPPGHRRGALVSSPGSRLRVRIAAIAAAAAVVATTLIGGALPAEAYPGSRAIPAVPGGFMLILPSTPGPVTSATLAAPGWVHPLHSVIPGTWSMQGPLGPTVDGRWGWCIQTGIPFWTVSPTGNQPVATQSVPTISQSRRNFLDSRGLSWLNQGDAAQRVAWMMADVENSRSQNRDRNAAVSLITKLFWEEGFTASEGHAGAANTGDDFRSEPIIQRTLGRMLDSFAGTPVVGTMRAMWDEAGAQTGRTAEPVTISHVNGNTWQGTVGGIGVRNGAGQFIAGIPFTATISGPATWNNGQTVITGTTGSSAIGNQGWTANGNGTVTVTVVYEGAAQDGLVMQRMAMGTQDYVMRITGGPTWSGDVSANIPVQFDFQPGVTTVARDAFINEGAPMVDRVTGHVVGDGEWIRGTGGQFLPVTVEVGTYGPFSREQIQGASSPSSTVPTTDRDGNPVRQVGLQRGILTGPGATVDMTTGNAPGSGYYVHVARVIRTQQPDAVRPHVHGDYWDGWAMPDETFITRQRMTVTTEVPASHLVVEAGTAWDDVITVAPVTEGGLWLAPNGTPLVVPMTAEIRGPFDYFGQNLGSAHATVNQTVQFEVNRYGSVRLSDLGVNLQDQPYSGFYTINARVDASRFAEIDARRAGETIRIAGQDLPIRISDFLDSRDHSAEHGWWQPTQTIQVQMQPQVVTQVSNRVIDESELPAVLDDAITLSLARPGDRWLHTGGPANPQPVPITVDNWLHGPFDTPQARQPWSEVTADFLARRLGNAPLTFTRPGTQMTSSTAGDYGFATVNPQDPRAHRNTAPSVLGPFGFYTWTSHIAPAPLHQGYDTDWWVEEETHTVRRELDKFSIVQDTNLVPGGRFADYMYIGNFPATQGSFPGLGGWAPDTNTARVQLFGPFETEPTALHADSNTPLFDTVEVPAGATALVGDFPDGEGGSSVGRFEIGFGDWDLARVPMTAQALWGSEDDVPWVTHGDGTQTATAWFVFVYEFDGDHRTVAFNSRLNDQRQMASVTYTRSGVTAPSIDIEKSHGTWLPAGDGNMLDRPNNHGDVELAIPDIYDWTALANNGDGTFTLVRDIRHQVVVTVLPDGDDDGDEVSEVDEPRTERITVTLTKGTTFEYDDDGFYVDTSTLDDLTDEHLVLPDQIRFATRTLTGLDADTEATRVLVPARRAVEVFFALTNNGNENLTRVRVDDITHEGPAIGEITWNQATNDDGYFVAADGRLLVLAPGERIYGSGILDGLQPGELHNNTAQVRARGQISGTLVGDNDDWWAEGVEPRIDIEKSSSFWVPAGIGNGEDADNNRNHTVLAPAIDDLTALRITRDGQGFIVARDVTATVTDTTHWGSLPGEGTGGWTLTGEVITFEPGTVLRQQGNAWQVHATDGRLLGSAAIPSITLSGIDADNEYTALKLGPGGWLNVFFRVTNVGNEPLTDITVDDVVIVGDRDINVVWDFEPGDDGYLLDHDGSRLELAPGEGFGGIGRIEGLEADEVHANEATATARGALSRIPVADWDQWWVVDPPLISTIAAAIEPATAAEDASAGVFEPWREVRGSRNEAVGLLGDYLRDRILIGGDVPTGSYVYVDLFFNEPGEPLTDENLIATSARLPVYGPAEGEEYVEFITERFGPTDRVGVWHFRERLYNPAGERLAEGVIGWPSETVYVIQPSTTAGFEDRNGNGVADVGDYFFDDIHVEGELPAGVEVAMWATAYRVPHEGVAWPEGVEIDDETAVIPGTGLLPGSREISEHLVTALVRRAWDGAGTYRTDGFILTANDAFGLGALTWMEHVIITNPGDVVEELGELPEYYVRVDGEWGVVEETLAPVSHLSGESGAGGGESEAARPVPPRPPLAVTGAELAPWIIAGLGLVALGGSFWQIGKYRKQRSGQSE